MPCETCLTETGLSTGEEKKSRTEHDQLASEVREEVSRMANRSTRRLNLTLPGIGDSTNDWV